MAARLAANAWDAETAEWAGQVQIPRQPHMPMSELLPPLNRRGNSPGRKWQI